MATQNDMTRLQSQPRAAAARQNAQPHDMDALDRLAARKARKAGQLQADKAEQAMEVADATQAAGAAEAQAAAQGSASAQMASAEGAMTADAAAAGAEATAGAAASAGTATGAAAGVGTAVAGLSPLAIGGGVLGVVAVAAAAGGGSSGGSSNASAPLAVKPPVSEVPADAQTPAAPAPATPPAAEVSPTPPAADTPANQPGTQPAQQPQQPAQTVITGPAIAQGEPGAPKVAETGETKLSNLKTLFETSAGEGTEVKFVRITNIEAAENSERPNARTVRYGDEGAKADLANNGDVDDNSTDAQGFSAIPSFVVRALPAEGTAQAGSAQQTTAQSGKETLTAYEVIESGTPLTLAEAQAQAQKLGGKLLTVDDQKELDWLNQNLKGLGHQGEGNDNGQAAWIGSNAVHQGNAMITVGTDDTGHKPETIAQGADARLSRFVIEYSNYQPPLTLNGKPVQEGQIINAEDFDKLVWNSTYSSSGAIRFEAVDSNNAQTARPLLPDEKPRTISISESADVKQPTAPAPVQDDANAQPGQPGGQPSQGGNALDKNQAGNGKPAETPNKDADASGKQDSQNGAQGDGKQPDTGDKPQPGQGESQHPPSTDPHNVPEQPVEHLPRYETQQPIKVAHDATHKLDAALFKGSDAEHPAEAVKILDVKPGTLKLDGQSVEKDQVITADQFEKLSWDASAAKGGEFRFIAVRPEEGHAHYDAAKVQAQTITIDEAAAAPKYPDSNTQTVEVRQNIQQTLGEALFKGSAADDAPAFIRIGKITETADANTTESALSVHKGRDTYTALKEGDEVSLENFKNIAWDSTQNNGGSFSFQALDHHRQAIDGSAVQTVTVHEKPNLPNYGDKAREVSVVQDTNHHLNAALFLGADGVKPAGVRVLYIHGADDQDGPVLKIGDDGQARTIAANDVIRLDEFDRVYLDASQFEGSASFKFVPVDEQGNNVQAEDAADRVMREVKITETAPQADLQASAPNAAESSKQEGAIQNETPVSKPEGIESQSGEGSPSGASVTESSETKSVGETAEHQSQKSLSLQIKDLLGNEELFGEAPLTAGNGHTDYAHSNSSLVSSLLDPLQEVPMA